MKHLAPQGVSGTAYVRCTHPEGKVVLVVTVVFETSTRVATKRAALSAPRAGARYSATARTSRCTSGFYQTRATALMGRHRLAGLGRHTVIECDFPADRHCDVTANAPAVVNNQILGQSDLTCASDRNDLAWSVHLEVNENGQWQVRPSAEQDGFPYRGGKTYHQAEREPCGAEPPPWPKDARTVVELKPGRGKAIDHTSPVTSITCRTPPVTLTVTLSGTGSGQVTSSPAGIDCPGTCSHTYPAGATVTLTATPSANSRFASWTGEYCGGQGSCQLTLVQDESVGADFESTSQPYGAAARGRTRRRGRDHRASASR